MVEVQDFVDGVLNQNSHHPDSSISHEAARFVVHSVFSEGFHKRRAHFLNIGVVKVLNLFFVGSVDSAWNFFQFNKNRGQSFLMFLEEFL
jgi:hypothetical protein